MMNVRVIVCVLLNLLVFLVGSFSVESFLTSYVVLVTVVFLTTLIKNRGHL